jgi:hypothetical protein
MEHKEENALHSDINRLQTIFCRVPTAPHIRGIILRIHFCSEGISPYRNTHYIKGVLGLQIVEYNHVNNESVAVPCFLMHISVTGIYEHHHKTCMS